MRLHIDQLEQELSQIKGEGLALDGIDVLELPAGIDAEYRRKP